MCVLLAISNAQQKLYGVQFHPEVDLSVNGKQMLKNFLFNVSGLSGSFTMQSREVECIEYIRKIVGGNKVLVCHTNINLLWSFSNYYFFFLQMLLSGGVDSTVCGALLRKALNPDQIIAFHIDNGFMRKDESILVEKSLKKIGLEMKSLCLFYFEREFFSNFSCNFSDKCFITVL